MKRREKKIRNLIKDHQQKIAKSKKRIDELNLELWSLSQKIVACGEA